MCVCYVYDALEISPCLLLLYHALPRCLKICSPVLLSLALLLTLIACVNVLRGSSPPSTVVIFAVLRFSLLTLKGLTPKRLNVSASPSHTRIQIVQSYVCLYVCMHVSTCSFLCAHPASWRLTSFGLLILRCFIDKEPVNVCVCRCLSLCATVLIVFTCTLHSLIVI